MSKKAKKQRDVEARPRDDEPAVVNISGQKSDYTEQMVKPGFGKNDNPPNSRKADRTARRVSTAESYRASLTDVARCVLADYPSAEQMQEAQTRADGTVPEPPDGPTGLVGGNVTGVRELPMGTSATNRIENVSAEPSPNTIREPHQYAGSIRARNAIPQGLVYPGDGPQAGLEPASLTDYLRYPEGPPAYGCAANGTCAGHCGGQCAAMASWAFRQIRRAAAR
ncbi:MAG: hypothetical protein ACRDRJ_00790 [Streptosporangiaceae bacterium]